MKARLERVEHELDPIYDKESRVLILGSLPSVVSRQKGFYYAHPQNRFWKIIATIFQKEIPTTIAGKIQFLKAHRIALWDVIKSCDIQGSSDSAIRNVEVNNISFLIKNTNIHSVFTTGRKSTDLYTKHIFGKTGIPAIYLPSSSPANRQYTFDELIERYS